MKCSKPFNFFITGGDGVEKSLLIKALSACFNKTFNCYSGFPDKSKTFLIAPTKATAINISGNTINPDLTIPINL